LSTIDCKVYVPHTVQPLLLSLLQRVPHPSSTESYPRTPSPHVAVAVAVAVVVASPAAVVFYFKLVLLDALLSRIQLTYG